MTLLSAFRERMEEMEQTRMRRLSLLQAEKELQIWKSQLLGSKLSNIKYMEERCLKLDCKIASQNLILSSLSSEVDRLESIYSKILQQLRVVKNEVAELEDLEKYRENYYVSESNEMEKFRAEADIYGVTCCLQLDELKYHTNEDYRRALSPIEQWAWSSLIFLLRSCFSKLQSNVNCSNNSEIAAAEIKKNQLLSEKENLDRVLASNYQTKEQLKKQLQNVLGEQVQLRKK